MVCVACEERSLVLHFILYEISYIVIDIVDKEKDKVYYRMCVLRCVLEERLGRG